MKPRDIVISYNFNQARKICYVNNLNIHKTIIFIHSGMYSTILNTVREYNEIKTVKEHNLEFMRKLQKLMGFKGLFTFYFEDKTEFEYYSKCLYEDIYIIFDRTIHAYISKLDPQVQKLYELSWKVR